MSLFSAAIVGLKRPFHDTNLFSRYMVKVAARSTSAVLLAIAHTAKAT